MLTRRAHITRDLTRDLLTEVAGGLRPRTQKLGRTLIDFSTLHLPASVTRVLADAFWNQVDVRSEQTVRSYWQHLKIFGRFAAETHAVASISDLRSQLLVRYIDWLNKQHRQDGTPWSKRTRYSIYMTLRTLLKWSLRCRSRILGEIEFPINPFPWTTRDARRVPRLPAQELRAILKACERDIAALRILRDQAEHEMAISRAGGGQSISTRGDLLRLIDDRYGGILPKWSVIQRRGHSPLQRALAKHGSFQQVEPCLYPHAESLFPYYLAVLIHTAGNPDPIAELTVDCLQPVPLLDDQELLVWHKGRTTTLQRRSFRSAAHFEPPALVREVLQWTRRLRPHAAAPHRNRLFLFKGKVGVSALSTARARALAPMFLAHHRLSPFTFAQIRPSVLSAFYRVSGDLRQAKAIANHARLSTTVSYVEGPEVEARNRTRVAALQSELFARYERPAPQRPISRDLHPVPYPDPALILRGGPAVSMFGFSCKNAFAGIAPGTRLGELCTNFLACFTCPNAIIPADAASLARLLQARDHLRAASSSLHPARWEAIYVPQLRILEEDILTRFSRHELVAAAALVASLPPLPELR